MSAFTVYNQSSDYRIRIEWNPHTCKGGLPPVLCHESIWINPGDSFSNRNRSGWLYVGSHPIAEDPLGNYAWPSVKGRTWELGQEWYVYLFTTTNNDQLSEITVEIYDDNHALYATQTVTVTLTP